MTPFNHDLFDTLTSGAALMMTSIVMTDIDEEERNDLHRRLTAIVVQMASALGAKHDIVFDDFVESGQELMAKARAKYMGMR